MRTGRSYVATAFALGIISLSGCAAETASDEDSKVKSDEDWGDETKYPELGGAFAQLTAVDGTCSVTNNAFKIEMNNTAQTVVVGARAVDSQILVNGVICGTTKGATTKTIKSLDIKLATDASAVAQSVVLDFLSGTFAPGAKAGPGITVNLGTGTDTVAVRGSTKADTYAIGAGASAGVTAVALNSDLFADMTLTAVENVTFSLASGIDIFTGQGGFGTGAAFASVVSVFGGEGADKLTGGLGADVIRGGEGADTIDGGAGNDSLFGDDGDDLFNTAATSDGADTYDCGLGELDKVSYEKRTAKLNVSIATADTVVMSVATPNPNDGEVDVMGVSTELDHVKAGCEIVTGGENDDILTGDGADNTLFGGKGNDTLMGGLGDDALWGGEGLGDTADYSERTAALTITLNDVTVGDDGDPAIPEADLIHIDVENVKGGTGIDTITGNDLPNEFWGGAGNDILTGGKGDDIFHEDGLPSAAMPPVPGTLADGSDTIDGGDGIDTVDYSKRVTSVLVNIDDVANDGLSAYTAAATVMMVTTPASWAASTENDNVKLTVENVLGGAASDKITAQPDSVAPAVDVVNIIDGGAGDDYLVGNDGNDTLSGGLGDDTIYAGAGDDTVEGGVGTNLADCGDGSDIAYSVTDLRPADQSCEILTP